ncbi:MAG: molybdopterin-dependent oxidoreductase [Chloroflexi bacterium]|nr:molybdopterin-dependent oxidoreductase [Chloroflexota bacterium]
MDYKNVLTTCIYCGTGCNYYLEVLDGEILGVTPCQEHPINQGQVCIKGWNSHAFVQHPDRLHVPLIRDGDGFREASWDEALGLVAERFQAIKAEHGPDAFGVLTSAKCTNEENYLVQRLARAVLGTNSVDHCARL